MPGLIVTALAKLAAMSNAQRNGLAAEVLSRAHARRLRGQGWVLPDQLRVRIRTPGGVSVTLSVGGQLATDAIARMRPRIRYLFAVRKRCSGLDGWWSH